MIRLLVVAIGLSGLLSGAELPRLAPNPYGVHQLLVDGASFPLVHAESENCSPSSDEYLRRRTFPALKKIDASTALLPITWELLEPVEGTFDFRTVESVLAQARAADLRVVLLWFGTWKNTHSSYAPTWVKADRERFPRAHLPPWGKTSTDLSAFGTETIAADAKAFTALMGYLRDYDTQHTVIMVQVQNEVGYHGTGRDNHPLAEAAWNAPVPPDIMSGLLAIRQRWHPRLAKAWTGDGRSWSAAFGAEAENCFSAWALGRAVEQIAAAGAAQKDLPMFVNAWQHSALDGASLAVWEVVAPTIDLIGVDGYDRPPEFVKDIALYGMRRPWFVAESQFRFSDANLFSTLVAGGFGFGPYTAEQAHLEPAPEGIRHAYRFTREAWRIIAPRQGGPDLVAILQQGTEPQRLTLGGLDLVIHWTTPDATWEKEDPQPASGLAIALEPKHYLFAGRGYRVEFRDPSGGFVEHLCHEEGTMRDGGFRPGRRLNGDQYPVRLNGFSPGYDQDPLPFHVVRIRVDTFR